MAAPESSGGHWTVDRAVGVSVVLLLHELAFYGLWASGLLPQVIPEHTVFVEMVAATDATPPPVKAPRPASPAALVPAPPTAPHEPPRPAPIPPQNVAVIPAPVLAVASPAPGAAAAPPSAVDAPIARAAPVVEGGRPHAAPAPVALGTELAVVCAERPAPAYPMASRRLRESGMVVVRVELDEAGHVANARIETSSGFARLDEAALSAVRNWRCSAAQQQGVAVRSSALQPFNFQFQ